MRPVSKKTRWIIVSLVLLMMSGCATSPTGKAAGNWQPLFDGKTLQGWRIVPGGQWQVSDGMIIGTSSASESRYGLLLSDQSYSDFTVRLKFKALKGNSGFYFRARLKEDGEIAGTQAEIDAIKETGGVYESSGRGWVVPPPTNEQLQQYYKPYQWNDMVITAQGANITVSVNGHKTVELIDDPVLPLQGHFAMQLHSGIEMEVMFKNIEIQTAP